jgi:TPR repeat protein
VRAAFGGNSGAQYALSCCYSSGKGTEKHPAKAFFYASKSAEQDNLKALGKLGDMHYWGQGCPVDFAKALDCFTRAAEMGDALSMESIAIIYTDGEGGIEIDLVQAFAWMRRAAEKGMVEPMRVLAEKYRDGDGCEKNGLEALAWFERYEQETRESPEHAQALHFLGKAYYEGGCGEVDHVKALDCFTRAAEMGDVEAMDSLSVLYKDGSGNGGGVEVDLIKSFKWMRLAAEGGDTGSMRGISQKYRKGEGCELDMNEAEMWKKKAKNKDKRNRQKINAAKNVASEDVVEE